MGSKTHCNMDLFIHTDNVDSARADQYTGNRDTEYEVIQEHTKCMSKVVVEMNTRCTRGVGRLVVQLVLESCGDTRCHLGSHVVDVPWLTCHARHDGRSVIFALSELQTIYIAEKVG